MEGKAHPTHIAAISHERVREEYDKAALTCSRIKSDAINDWRDNDGDDLDLLPYYEGRRDALHALLNPEEVCHGLD